MFDGFHVRIPTRELFAAVSDSITCTELLMVVVVVVVVVVVMGVNVAVAAVAVDEARTIAAARLPSPYSRFSPTDHL